MKNDLFRYVFFLICLSCMFFSCLENKVLSQSTYPDFISNLRNSTPEKRQSELQRIREGLSKALDEAEDYGVYFGMSMSFSTINETTIDWDTVNWNRLDIEEASINLISPAKMKTQFKWYVDSAYATQQRRLPNSDFSIETESYASIDKYDVKTNIIRYFSEKGMNTSSKIGLIRVDSLDVEFSYNHTLSLDTLVIKQGVDSVVFQGYTIYIKKLTPQHIELNLPIELYHKFVDHLGVTPNGKYISSKNKSYMPSWGLARSIANNAYKALDILDKYCLQPINDDDLERFETELTEECYVDLHKVFDFIEVTDQVEKEIEKKNDDFAAIGILRRIIEDNAVLFEPVKQNMEIGYPYPVKEILFCFTKDTANFSGQKIIPVDHEFDPPYDRIYDISTSKFGVVDSIGEIIIEPKYKNLQSLGDLFFYDGEAKATFRLDVGNKKMKPVKTKYRYLNSLGSEVYVFYSEEGYSGLLNSSFDEIVPFKYDMFKKEGRLVVGYKRENDNILCDLFTDDGKKIQLPPITEVLSDRFASGIILVDEDSRMAFMTSEGKLVIPFNERVELRLIGSDKVIFMKRGDVCYFVDKQGNQIRLPENVYRVYGHDEIYADENFVFIDENSLCGFLNEKGEVILPPTYEEIYGNKKDISLVKLSDRRRVLVNDEGQILKEFGSNSYIETKEYNDDLYYIIDDIVYDWKGNKSNLSESDLYY